MNRGDAEDANVRKDHRSFDSGLPTRENVHEAALRADPGAIRGRERTARRAEPRRIMRLFDGSEVVEPGLAGPTEWRPQDDEAADEKFAGVVGVAVKR